MKLIVCPLATFDAVCAEARPDQVVQFVAPGETLPPSPAGTRPLVIACNDIEAERDGLVAPNADHIDSLVSLSRRLGAGQTVLVQCALGVSRSSAAAAILLCARHPEIDEGEILAALRRASPIVTPNPLMIALADRHLARQGRLVAAAMAIGRGADYVPYRTYTLPDFDARP